MSKQKEASALEKEETVEDTSQDGHVSQAGQDPLKKATPSENFDNENHDDIKTEVNNESFDGANNISGLDFEYGDLWENGDNPWPPQEAVVGDEKAIVGPTTPQPKAHVEIAAVDVVAAEEDPSLEPPFRSEMGGRLSMSRNSCT